MFVTGIYSFSRTLVSDVQQRASVIQTHMGQVQQGGGGGGGGANPQMALVMHELQENLRSMKSDVSHLVNRPQVCIDPNKVKYLNVHMHYVQEIPQNLTETLIIT